MKTLSKKSIRIIFLAVLVVIFFLTNIFTFYNQTFKLKNLEQSQIQIVDVPECGVSVQFPKEINGIPILAYREPFTMIHSGSENVTTGITTGENGVLIGNPHLNYRDKTQNLSISCRKKLNVETPAHLSRKLSNLELKKLTGWDLADNVSDIYQSGYDKDFLGTINSIITKTGFGYQSSWSFVFEDKVISTNQILPNFPVVGFWGQTGILASSINILPINKVPANTQINQKVWEYTEKNIKIETKEVNFDIPVGDQILTYTDKYIWKTKNGQKLKDSSTYLQTKVSFRGEEIANLNSYYIDSYENKFGKPLYKAKTDILGDSYIIAFSFQDNKIVIKSENKGQTWTLQNSLNQSNS
jgi:hypothetical protein